MLSRYYERREYTLSFEVNGGSAVAPVTAKHGSAVELPETISRYGYVFGGWYLDEGLTEEAALSIMPMENTTVYAKWTPVGADRGTEYHINGITLLGPDYQAVETIPTGSFYAQVSVTNLCSETMDTLILATYDKDGRMLDLDFLFADPQVGQTFILGAMIDNADGEIAEIRAFMLPMLGGTPVPLANSATIGK